MKTKNELREDLMKKFEQSYIIKPGDVLTIPSREIFCETFAGNKITYVIAVGENIFKQNVTRKIALRHFESAKGEWTEHINIFGIFARPFKIKAITDYGYKKELILVNP